MDIRDVGPCKKHIKVTVARENIDGRLGEKYSELVAGPGEAAVFVDKGRCWEDTRRATFAFTAFLPAAELGKSAAGGIVSGGRRIQRPAGQPFALPISASTARRIASGRSGRAATTRARFGISRATAPDKRWETVPACGQCANASCFRWPSCRRRVKRAGKGGSMR